MQTPVSIELIGTEIAFRWSDGAETYATPQALRKASPSAETQGEKDIFGTQYGGNQPTPAKEVQVTAWEKVGNYAIRFEFSDGHRTGLYSFDYLRKITS
jgi:DUF971 family protein